MADKLEFSEKLVYDYFKQHKLHKSGAYWDMPQNGLGIP